MPPLSLLRAPVFRAFLAANPSERFAASAMTVLMGFQVYELTHNPLDLAWLGLIEAIPGNQPGPGQPGAGRASARPRT
jgi:hypothetical protein